MSGETSDEGTTVLAVEVEDIVGKDSFRDWLSGQTVDLARLLATRIALRTLPNVLIIHSTDASQVTKDNARKLTLHCFRASFLSWTAIEYPTHVMGPKAYSAAKSAADHGRLAVYEIIESATKSAAHAANAADSASSAILCSANSAAFSARSAANSVTTYPARSVAQASIWEFIRTDASTVLMDGTSDVFASPLWPKTKNNVANQKIRVYVEKQITDFKQTEEYTALPWDLWIAWWESLQNDTSHSLFGEIADLEIARKNDEFWDRDVAVVMDELAKIVGWPWGEERKSEIPPQQAAPIEAEFQDDKIVRQYSSHLQPTQGIPQIHALLLREAISMRDWISPQMAGAGALFDELIAELGSSLEATNIYGVGFWETSLQQFSQRVDEQFLEDNAARFAGLMINLDRFLKQSVDWQEYIKNVHAAELGGLDPEKANTAVSEIVEAISNEEVVDESISQPLTQLKQALLGAQTFNPETTYGFYRSLANVIQVVASVSISAGKEPVKNIAVDVGHELRKKSIAWTATGILTMASGAFLYLTGALPTMFGFLNPILAALKKG